MTPDRKQIGRATSLGTREVIFLTDRGVECDSTDQLQIAQRRVLFEDAQLLTLHRQSGRVLTSITAIVALLFLAAAYSVYEYADVYSAMPALICGAFFAGVAIFRIFVKPTVITIFGKRSKITIRFTLKHQLARETYEELRLAIRNKVHGERAAGLETQHSALGTQD